jgi:hypothetical protein
VFALTATVSVAVELNDPSLTCSVKVAVLAGPQAAMRLAVIVPFVLDMAEIVTSFEVLPPTTVTVRLPAYVSASLTVAIVELLPVLPATRLSPVVTLITGERFGTV